MNKLFTLLLAAGCFTVSAQVPDYVPTEGLLGWWSFEESLDDLSGNSNHGTAMGSVDFVAGLDGEGMAVSFNEAVTLIHLEGLDSFDFVNESISFSGWVNWSGTFIGGSNNIIRYDDCISSGYLWGVELTEYSSEEDAANALKALDQNRGGAMNNIAIANTLPTTNSWAHVVCVRDVVESTNKLYLNGQLIGETLEVTQPAGGANRQMLLGSCGGYSSTQFIGQMDECGIWNVALSPGAVQSLYAQEAINAGCMDSAACNYNDEAGMDDGSCHYLCNYCLEGTVWNEAEGGCVLDPSSCGWQPDSNDDQLIGVDDLLMFLSVFGDTDYDQDGVFDSADLCMDEEACNYLANPTEPCAFLDAAGICGGTCETDIEGDGVCDDPCPEGYTGVDCSEHITPSSLTIPKVHVLDFPPYDDGSSWDLNGSAPDILLSIWNASGSSELYRGGYYENAMPPEEGDEPYKWNSVNLLVNNPLSTTRRIRLYNIDLINPFADDEYMGGINATLYTEGNGFPESLPLYASGGVIFEVFFEYSW